MRSQICLASGKKQRLFFTFLRKASLHFDDAIDCKTVSQLKQEIVTLYKITKSGVDTVDQTCSTYSVTRSSRCWPVVIFYAMFNRINAQVIYMGNKNEVEIC